MDESQLLNTSHSFSFNLPDTDLPFQSLKEHKQAHGPLDGNTPCMFSVEGYYYDFSSIAESYQFVEAPYFDKNDRLKYNFTFGWCQLLSEVQDTNEQQPNCS